MNAEEQTQLGKTLELLGGLSQAEVEQQRKRGHINEVTTAPERTVKDIIKANFVTPFNLLNLILFLLVLIAGKPLNATFVFVILFNTLIGTVQELRAKSKLDELAVLNTEQAIVLREHQLYSIPVNEIVLHDIVKYDAGKQIMIDGLVCANRAEVDEALLTGESDAIVKTVGDEVHGGTFVVAGSIFVQATKIGDDVYANKLASEAKNFSLTTSELTNAINQIIKFVSGLILPIGLALLLTQLFASGSTWQDAIINAVAGIIGMIPEGLVLLTSVAFMVGSIQLSRKQTLVQEMSAIESLARVDVLCLDKTGTLTEGILDLVEVKHTKPAQQEKVDQALGSLAYYLPAANATQLALQKKYEIASWEAETIIPFSSQRKWSGISFKRQGTWILGAPEVLFGADLQAHESFIDEQQTLGNRVVALAYTKTKLTDNTLPQHLQLQAFLIFADIIRPHAMDTLQYFAQQDVAVKIISGDHPKTLLAIAQKVGLDQDANIIAGADLPQDFTELQTVVEQHTIFGRVSPKQKQRIIQALQANGHVVGMTGDGVNDILALKQADCSMAMASGSEASRTVAQLVLMHSDFSSLPEIVAQGRKIINNIERVTSLYLVKTFYSIVLSITFIILMLPYPFNPLQLSIISTLMVGIPTFFLALEENAQRVSGNFLDNVLKQTIPAGLSITLAIVTVYLSSLFLPMEQIERTTIAFIVLGGLQFVILTRVSRPWKLWKIGLLSLLLVVFLLICFRPRLIEIMNITTLSFNGYLLVVGIWLVYVIFYKYSRAKIERVYEKNKERFSQIFRK